MEGIVYILLALAVLVLLSVVTGLIILRERDQGKFSDERLAWAKERHDLNNRIMARDWTSYLAMVQSESDTLAAEAEKQEEEKTTDYEKAWMA